MGRLIRYLFFTFAILSLFTINPVSARAKHEPYPVDVSERLPDQIAAPGERVVIVNPRVHAFGAYNAEGELVYSGMASSGANYCPDIGRRCHTKTGTFRVYQIGGRGCRSSIYPLGRGGAPMPYCMFFHRNFALHGSYEVRDGNVSHGCVRLHVQDAEWLYDNFITRGTKVVILPY